VVDNSALCVGSMGPWGERGPMCIQYIFIVIYPEDSEFVTTSCMNIVRDGNVPIA